MSARSSGRLYQPMSWCATVGAMKEHSTQAYATCTGGCGWERNPLDLDPIIAKFGPDYSLWDRRPRCKSPGCRGLILFLCRPGGTHGTPYRPMKSW